MGLFHIGWAQDYMRISYKNGLCNDVPIAQIDSIMFVEGNDIIAEPELKGRWFWGGLEQGYYELLTFSEDHTYTGYDNYFTYGFDTMTFGWWGQMGAMLSLQSNGFGYQRRYNWYVTDLTENALGVMTKKGPFTYYRLQDDVIKINKDGSLYFDQDEECVFADGIIVKQQEGNKMIGASEGETYILKKISPSQLIWAYKVIVE
jgi:hypothetical protein